MKNYYLAILICFLTKFSFSQTYMKIAGNISQTDSSISGVNGFNNSGSITIGGFDNTAIYFWSKDVLGLNKIAASGFTTNGEIVLNILGSNSPFFIKATDIVELKNYPGVYVISGYGFQPLSTNGLIESGFLVIIKEDGTILHAIKIDNPMHNLNINSITTNSNPSVNDIIYFTGSSNSLSGIGNKLYIGAMEIISGGASYNLLWSNDYDLSLINQLFS